MDGPTPENDQRCLVAKQAELSRKESTFDNQLSTVGYRLVWLPG